MNQVNAVRRRTGRRASTTAAIAAALVLTASGCDPTSDDAPTPAPSTATSPSGAHAAPEETPTAPPTSQNTQALEPGTQMCQLGDPDEGIFYLFLVSKADFDFSACKNAPTVPEDGYSIPNNPAYGPDVDVRCYVDSGDYMANAVGIVYSSANPLDRQNALEFCRNVEGYDFN